jgi:hypothetical protein
MYGYGMKPQSNSSKVRCMRSRAILWMGPAPICVQNFFAVFLVASDSPRAPLGLAGGLPRGVRALFADHRPSPTPPSPTVPKPFCVLVTCGPTCQGSAFGRHGSFVRVSYRAGLQSNKISAREVPGKNEIDVHICEVRTIEGRPVAFRPRPHHVSIWVSGCMRIDESHDPQSFQRSPTFGTTTRTL